MIEAVRSRTITATGKGTFLSNTLTLVSGTIIAQILTFVFSPLLARLFTPDQFGVYSLYISIASLLSIIATARYEEAILLPADDIDAKHLMILSLAICVAVSVVSLAIVILFRKNIAMLFRDTVIGQWLHLIPLSILLAGIYQSLGYWANRKKKYWEMSFSRIVQSASTALASVTAGLLGTGAGGLIVGTLLGQGAAAGILGWDSMWREKWRGADITKERIVYNAGLYKNFPRYNLFQGFLDTIKTSGIVFLIAYFFNATVLGLYSLALRVLQIPFTLIGSAVAQVLYQKAADIYNSDRKALGRLIWSTFKKLAMLSIVVIIPATLVTPKMFTVLFGSQWRDAGVLAIMMMPWFVLNFISSPLSCVPMVTGRQKSFLVIGIVYNISLLLVFSAASYYLRNIAQALLTMSLYGALYLVGVIVWILRIAGDLENEI